MEKSTGSRQEGDQKQKKKKMTIYTVNKIQEPKKPEEEPPKDTKVTVTPEQVGEFIGTVFLTPLVLLFAWSFVAPTLFGLATINYIQSFAILIIARCFRQ